MGLIDTSINVQKYYPVFPGYKGVLYRVGILLEDLISTQYFRNNKNNPDEPNRVIMSTNDFALKKRMKQLNTESETMDLIVANTLRLPFANYDIISGTGIKPEVNTTTFAMAKLNIFPDLGYKVNALKIDMEIPVTFYWDRWDDYSICQNKIIQESYTYRYLTIPYVIYESKIIKVPVMIRPVSITFNKESTEKKWLQDNKIYTLTANYFAKTLLIELPSSVFNLDEEYGYDYSDLKDIYDQMEKEEEINSPAYVTTKVLLDWYIKNQKLSEQVGSHEFSK